MSRDKWSTSEMESETWEPVLEMSPQLEIDRRSMMFRLARKRAAYFADVGDLSSQASIDELPTQRQSALWQAIKMALIVTRVLSLEEQPTLEIPIAERSTLVPATTVSLSAFMETPTLTHPAITPDAVEKNTAACRVPLFQHPGMYALTLPARKLALWLFWGFFVSVLLLYGICLISLGKLWPLMLWHHLRSGLSQELPVAIVEQ